MENQTGSITHVSGPNGVESSETTTPMTCGSQLSSGEMPSTSASRGVIQEIIVNEAEGDGPGRPCDSSTPGAASATMKSVKEKSSNDAFDDPLLLASRVSSGDGGSGAASCDARVRIGRSKRKRSTASTMTADPSNPDIPDGVPRELWPLVRDFRLPNNFRRMPLQPNVKAPYWFCGARALMLDDNGQVGEEGWVCLANESCRRELVFQPFNGSTSKWSQHLARKHQIVSDKSLVLQETKREHQARKDETATTNFHQMTEERYHRVNLVRLIVRRSLPFSIAEDEELRTLLGSLGGKVAPTKLSAEAAKHTLIEMYVATKSKIQSLLKSMRDSPLPSLHLNLDMWTDRYSKRKFIAVRVFGIDKWVLTSVSLAVKLYNPSSVLNDTTKASDILLLWLKAILEEWGLGLRDFLSFTFDSGTEIKRLLSKVVDFDWTWCAPHMANCALSEAMGSCLDPTKSKNKPVRDLMMRVKGMVGRMNKSPQQRQKFHEVRMDLLRSCIKLPQDAPHRWLCMGEVVRTILKEWPVLEQHFRANETMAFPLADFADALPQLFALVAPIVRLISTSQSATTPVAGMFIMQMTALKNTVLNVDAPLKVTPVGTSVDEELGEITVPADTLEPIVQDTRKLLSHALVSRFYAPYWQKDSSVIADITLALHPALKNLTYMWKLRLKPGEVIAPRRASGAGNSGKVSSSAGGGRECEGGTGGRNGASKGTTDAEVKTRQELVWQKVRSLATQAEADIGNSIRGAGADSARSMRDDKTVPTSKTRKTVRRGTPRKDIEWQAEEFNEFCGKSIGLEHDPADLDTPEKVVDAELAAWRGEDALGYEQCPFDEVLSYWKDEGSKRYPALARVARAVYGHPASSAAVERDFGEVGNLLTCRRSRMDAAFVEMSMFLKFNFDDIPCHVDKISRRDRHRHIPRRLMARALPTKEDDEDAPLEVDALIDPWMHEEEGGPSDGKLTHSLLSDHESPDL